MIFAAFFVVRWSDFIVKFVSLAFSNILIYGTIEKCSYREKNEITVFLFFFPLPPLHCIYKIFFDFIIL